MVFGDGEQKLGVQFGVVLGQGLVAIVIDELHYRQEGKRLREAIPPVSVVDLYKLVVPPFPAGGDRSHMRTRRKQQDTWLHMLTFSKGLGFSFTEGHISLLSSVDSAVVLPGVGDGGVALPEGERVLALQFTGGISDQEGAIWSVSQLLVHLLSANTMTCSIYFMSTNRDPLQVNSKIITELPRSKKSVKQGTLISGSCCM